MELLLHSLHFVETVNFIVKRVFRGSVRSLWKRHGPIEILCRCIVYIFRRLFWLVAL